MPPAGRRRACRAPLGMRPRAAGLPQRFGSCAAYPRRVNQSRVHRFTVSNAAACLNGAISGPPPPLPSPTPLPPPPTPPAKVEVEASADASQAPAAAADLRHGSGSPVQATWRTQPRRRLLGGVSASESASSPQHERSTTSQRRTTSQKFLGWNSALSVTVATYCSGFCSISKNLIST